MIQPTNSRDVMPKNVPGVGWVMVAGILEGGSLLVDMRPYGCFIV